MGKHSIKNPDSFSDSIEMLLTGAGCVHPEYCLDILSERCFYLAFENNSKTWIQTGLSVKESINNLFQNTGILLKVTNTNLLTQEQLSVIGKEGAVIGPIERKQFNQAVEDMYFLGGKHFVYLAGIVDDCFILHDPDSSPCILVEIRLFEEFIRQTDAYCITFEREMLHPVDYKKIINCNLIERRRELVPVELPVLNNGIGSLASYKYGLRLYLYYQREIFDLIISRDSSAALLSARESFFQYAAEGFGKCDWNYFWKIVERGEDLLYKAAKKYVRDNF